jgi:predicted regulator of Ras-like GTPase activity (Roadblock/LC7/MglB family)
MNERVLRALDRINRVRGVRGAMLVSLEDGLVVADSVMDGVKSGAVAALAASLTNRLRKASTAGTAGAPVFVHLQCEQGALLAVPASRGLLVAAVGDAEVNIGLARLEMLRVAEATA